MKITYSPPVTPTLKNPENYSKAQLKFLEDLYRSIWKYKINHYEPDMIDIFGIENWQNFSFFEQLDHIKDFISALINKK